MDRIHKDLKMIQPIIMVCVIHGVITIVLDLLQISIVLGSGSVEKMGKNGARKWSLAESTNLKIEDLGSDLS